MWFAGTGYGSELQLAPLESEGTFTRGSRGTERSGRAKENALVRSPVTERLHALRLGTSAPNRVSRKRSTEVWSKRSEQT